MLQTSAISAVTEILHAGIGWYTRDGVSSAADLKKGRLSRVCSTALAIYFTDHKKCLIRLTRIPLQKWTCNF
jgi:hypothetical protein